MWQELVIAFIKHHKKHTLDVDEDGHSALFHNKAIDRRLGREGVVAVVGQLVTSGYAQWAENKQTCVVYHQTFTNVGTLLLQWAQDNTTENISTLYDLSEELKIPEAVLLAAVEVLAGLNKAVVLPGDTLSETGVKFQL
jgi:hypothetical protein